MSSLKFFPLSALPVFAVLFGTLSVVCSTHAALKPYDPDPSTLHLYHFDEEPEQTIARNLGTVGGFAVAIVERSDNVQGHVTQVVTSPKVLGAPATPGFGFSARVNRPATLPNPRGSSALGYDSDGNGAFGQTNAKSKAAGDDQYIPGLASLKGSDGSFTLEALINLDVDVTSLAEDEIVRPRVIIAADSTTDAQRGWTFRISRGAIEFAILASSGGRMPEFLSVPIPRTGPHAFAAGRWFHVAYTYDAGPGLVRVYWTSVDSEAEAAAVLHESKPGTRVALPNVKPHLTFGGDGRRTLNESLGGQIDEVRISSVARGPDDFIFHPGLSAARDGRDVILGWSGIPSVVGLINIYRNTKPVQEGRQLLAGLHAGAETFIDRAPSGTAFYWYWISYKDSSGRTIERGPTEAKISVVWQP